MLGTAISGGLKVAGAIYGGIKAAQAARKQRQQLRSEISSNNDYLARRMYEDATQRADAQAVLTEMRNTLASSNRNQRGVNAVTGASNEIIAAQKQAASDAIGSTMANINAAAVSDKNTLESQVRAQNSALNQKIGDSYMAQAQGISDTANALGNVGAGIASNLTDYLRPRQ